MNIPFASRCLKCAEEHSWNIRLNESETKWQCSACGHVNPEAFQDNITIGEKLLWRSCRELVDHKDAPMSIVLSAMGLDCESSRIFRKSLGPTTDVEFERSLRKAFFTQET